MHPGIAKINNNKSWTLFRLLKQYKNSTLRKATITLRPPPTLVATRSLNIKLLKSILYVKIEACTLPSATAEGKIKKYNKKSPSLGSL
jgi:hypothetical protein